MPGIALAVTDRERVIHVATSGFADVAAGQPVTPETLFETGSIGKSFTAVALLQLAEEGRIDLQAPVTDYLPWFAVQSEFAPITLHHLLTHTAGITAGVDFAPEGQNQVWALRDERAATPPGTFFHYSNVGYKVLGLVLERVGGELYGAAIQRRVLDPLGLVDSIPVITNADRPRLAVGYSPLYDDRPWWPGRRFAPAIWLETDTADGCLAMPAADLAAFLRMLLNRGATPAGRLLSEASFELFAGRHAPMGDGDGPYWYGYGLVTEEQDGRSYLGHGGGMVGYVSAMLGDLDAGLGVVVLVNGWGEPEGIARAALDALVAASDGREAALPAIADPYVIEDAAAYVGHYTAVALDGSAAAPESVEIEATGDRLLLRHAGGESRLGDYYGQALFTDDPAFDRFVMGFERRDDAVVALTHGGRYFTKEGNDAPRVSELPEEWAAYPGHYRSFSPWTPAFRVVRRLDRLWLIFPVGPDGFDDEQPLVPLEDGWFRTGDDERIPERIRFDTVVEGRALRAHLGSGAYYRVNWP